MSKRDQLDYVQFDVGFFNKPKVKALKFKFGQLALLAYIETLCDLGAATNAEVDDDVFLAICQSNQIDAGKSQEILSYLLDNQMLFRGDSKKLSNSRIVEDQEAIAAKRDSWRNRQSKTRDTTTTSPICHASVTRDNAVTLNTEDHEDHEDLNLPKKKDSPDLGFCEIPCPPRVASAFHRWRGFQKLKFGREFDQIQAESCWMSWRHLGEKLADSIDWSIGNGFRNITEKPDKTTDPTKVSQFQKLSPTERSMQAAKNVDRMLTERDEKRAANLRLK